MAGGFNVPFLADVSGFIKGTDNMSDALEDVADSLDDLGKNKGTDKLEDGLDDAAKAAKDLDRKVSEAFDSIADDARKTGKTIGKEIDDGADKAKAGMDDLKSESAGTAKEAAASFSGIDDAAGAAQEALANVFVGFGPAGAAAGIVAAVGLGLAISALETAAEKTNEAKQDAIDLAAVWRENGGAFTMATAIEAMDKYGDTIVDTKEWWELFQSEAVTGWEQIRDRAEAGGVSMKDAFNGAFGPAEDAAKVQAELAKRIEEVERSSVKTSGAMDETGQAITYVTDEGAKQLEGLRGLKSQIDENVKKQQDATEIERIRKEAIKGTTEAIREDIDALEERADLIKDSITTELDHLDNVAALGEKLKEGKNAWDINTAAGRENRRAVLDVASGIEDMARAQLDAGAPVADVTKKFQAQKDALITQVMPAFGNSREAARKYIEQILQTPKTATTKVKLDGVPEADGELNALANKQRTATVGVRPQDLGVQDFINRFHGQTVYLNFAGRGGNPTLP